MNPHDEKEFTDKLEDNQIIMYLKVSGETKALRCPVDPDELKDPVIFDMIFSQIPQHLYQELFSRDLFLDLANRGHFK